MEGKKKKWFFFFFFFCNFLSFCVKEKKSLQFDNSNFLKKFNFGAWSVRAASERGS